MNFQYCGVEYDYDSNSDDCHCFPDYCRCSTIENAKVTSVNVSMMVKHFIETRKIRNISLHK